MSTALSALTIASNIGITWYRAVHLERRLDQRRLLDAQRAEYLGVAVNVALTTNASPQQRRAAQDLAMLLVAHQTRDAPTSALHCPARP